MASQRVSSKHLQQKISTFCDVRIAPAVSQRELGNIRSYLVSLVIYRKRPPLLNGRIHWAAIAEACGFLGKFSADLKRRLQPGLDAILRWADTGIIASDDQHSDQRPTSRAHCTKAKAPPMSRKPPDQNGTASACEEVLKTRRGPKPKSIDDQPVPLFDVTNHPAEFREALTLQMQRHGETCRHLHRAIVSETENFDRTTLSSWIAGDKTPRSVMSFEILSRIEQRYRLEPGYFKSRLPHQARSVHGLDVGDDVGPAERRRLAWHLPDDFNVLPFAKRQEILEWVRRVIISGSTDYRRFQAKATKQRYAIRFPGIAYGGTISPRFDTLSLDDEAAQQSFQDPDLLSGVIDAPPRLALEMAGLIRFKTSILTDAGLQRNGVWGEETASQKIEHLGLMFGALAAAPNGEVKGHGVPVNQMTFGLLIFPGVWDWYLQWRERRRGFYTKWEDDMLTVAMALARSDTGWIRQHPELLKHVRPIKGLVGEDEIAAAANDWHGACEGFFKHAANRSKEIRRVMRVHRDPFEPIMCILEADSPLHEYRKITDEILRRIPDEHRYPRSAAEAVRAFLMLRLGLHLGLRQKNLRQLMVCPRGKLPTSERRLEDMKRGELRWSDRYGGWEVLIPSRAFKNASSSFFGSKPFRLVLPDYRDLYAHIDAYVERHRGVLLNGATDPGTFFVKTVKTTSRDASYDQTTFYEAWRLVIQRYGIFNPYTGRGAIDGLLPHGPHNLRDVLATHILKQTGSFEQASYAIQDTPDMVANHYGRFLPQDKAALAAKILNQVREAA
ncbi:hypothetical protein ABFT80_26670 [Mesorhizobium sp. SB112]|uniref:hypothetical protein n=1 Tax=Mesorhizobium sp. SB112 TaxID=3151853 RepID=UPI0032662D8C